MEIPLPLEDTDAFKFRHASGMDRMSLRVSCLKCNATLKVDDDFVGQNVICPSCRSTFRIEKSGTETNEGRDAQFVSVQVPAETPKKKRRGRTSKRKQKARAARGRNPIGAFAFLLIAGIATWFAFFRPSSQQIASVAPSQRTEAEQASDSAAVSAPRHGGMASAGRTVTSDSRGQVSAVESSDPSDRFQIIWAPRHVIRHSTAADAE